MDVTTEIRYPGASVEKVVALLFDPRFRQEVCMATLAIDQQVDVEPGADGAAVVTITRTLPAQVPDFVKRFVGETITLAQTETWAPDDGSGVRRADLVLRVVGQPAAMNGSITVGHTEGEVVETVNGDLQVSVPFFGGRVEAEIVTALEAAARVEEETGRAWLAR